MNIVDFAVANYSVRVAIGSAPAALRNYQQKAALHDCYALDRVDADYLLVTFTLHEASWPSLVVEQRFESHQVFNPGILVVPDADTAFIGAGTRLLAYALTGVPRLLWEDTTACGFFCWQQHVGVVLMSAELELAAWSLTGEKLWSMFVEPPWHYTVAGTKLTLDVMGTISAFPIAQGPSAAR